MLLAALRRSETNENEGDRSRREFTAFEKAVVTLKRSMLCIDANNATRINRVVGSFPSSFFDPILGFQAIVERIVTSRLSRMIFQTAQRRSTTLILLGNVLVLLNDSGLIGSSGAQVFLLLMGL